jgi:ketosteroid isomerase-like protein
MKDAQSNVRTVETIYAAFGRGDVPAILEHLAEDVEWEYGQAENPVPWLQRRSGRAAVGQFFAALSALEFHKFVPKVMLEGAGVVVALIDLEATVKQTGRRIAEEDETHIWRFDDRGSVIRFRHAVDTAQHVAAFRG